MWDRHYINRPDELCSRNYEDNTTAEKEPSRPGIGCLAQLGQKKAPPKGGARKGLSDGLHHAAHIGHRCRGYIILVEFRDHRLRCQQQASNR